jgi:cytoskeletal protein CcmA (bactofilin family)
MHRIENGPNVEGSDGTTPMSSSVEPGRFGLNQPVNQLTQLHTSTQSPSAQHALPSDESLEREIKEGKLSGYIGPGTVITGETTFNGIMRIDGQVGGRVSSEGGTIIVGDSGQIIADLNVAVALIRGTVSGDIIASQRLELGRTAKVRGNIQTASLSIEEGAVFEGNCRMAPVNQGTQATNGPQRQGQDFKAIAATLDAAVRDESVEAPVSGRTSTGSK